MNKKTQGLCKYVGAFCLLDMVQNTIITNNRCFIIITYYDHSNQRSKQGIN